MAAHVLELRAIPEGVVIAEEERPRDDKGRFIRAKARSNKIGLRQIRKFVTDYMNNVIYWKIRQGAVPQSLHYHVGLPTLEQYAQYLNHIKRYEYCIEKRINKTGPIGDDIYRIGSMLNGNVKYIQSNLEYRHHKFPRPSKLSIEKLTGINPTDVFSDLYALVKTFPSIYNYKRGSIKILTDEIKVVSRLNKGRRYNFGRFWIELYPSFNNPSVCPLTPKKTKRPYDGLFYHPHLQGDSGSLCLGDGGPPMSKALHSGRFFDVVEIYMATLGTHGRGHDAAQLNGWDGICDETFDPKTGLTITPEAAKDMKIACPCCKGEVPVLKRCCCNQICETEACEGCMDKCSYPHCNQYSCENHYSVCETCEKRFCTYPNGKGSAHLVHSSTMCNSCWENEDDSWCEDEEENEPEIEEEVDDPDEDEEDE